MEQNSGGPTSPPSPERSPEPAPDRTPGPGPRTREPGTLKIGQIGGVDVLVRSSWLLVAALISVMLAPAIERVEPGLGSLTYVAGLAFAVLLYLSVLLHEASHALMAQRFGLPVKSITLHFLGGVTEIEGEPDTPGREFAVSVVGPLTSLAVAAVVAPFVFLLEQGSLLHFAATALAGANLVVGVLNLVPGLPLDGGRVLRAAVWKATGNPHRGTIVAGWGGRVAAVLALSFPFVSQFGLGRSPDLIDYVLAFVIASFLWTGASAAIVSAKVRRKLPALRARTLARRALTVPEQLPVAEAVRRAQHERAGSIVVVDTAGRPSALVNEAAVAATPADRQPWLPVREVARTLEPGLRLSADLTGEALLRAMQQAPSSEYLLVERDGSVFGVLVTDDVDRAFAAGL